MSPVGLNQPVGAHGPFRAQNVAGMTNARPWRAGRSTQPGRGVLRGVGPVWHHIPGCSAICDEWSNSMPTGQKYLVHDLKTLERGATVVVHLSGSAANVRLMDSSNYQAYRSNRNHRYLGGLVKRSPHRMVVPKSAHWYLTVDMAGLRGTTHARVTVEPPPLPIARSATDHGSLANLRNELPTGVDPAI